MKEKFYGDQKVSYHQFRQYTFYMQSLSIRKPPSKKTHSSTDFSVTSDKRLSLAEFRDEKAWPYPNSATAGKGLA